MKKKSRLLSLGLAMAMVFALNIVPVFAITGNAAVPGSEVTNDDSGETNELYAESGSVATVSGENKASVGYSSLADAFAAAVSGDTITLQSDAAVSELIEIKSSQNITLNLAGYTISGSMSSRMFAVSGTLTIKASDGGTITNTGSSNVISNGGTLVIESGTITATSAYAIYNTGTLTVNGGTITGGTSGTGYAVYIAGGIVTINGGTFTSTNTGVGAVRNNATLIINAGTVGNTTDDIYGVYNAGTVTVNGGTLSGSTAGLINAESGSSVTVYAGTLQGGKRGLYNSTGTATIYGGSFSGSEYGLMTNSPSTNVSTVYAGTFNGGSRAIIGYLTSTIATSSYYKSGSYDRKECIVASYFGISTDSTVSIPVESVSGKGESIMYAEVSGNYIESYSTSAYPTTSLTFTDSDGTKHNYIFAGWYSCENGTYTAMTSFPTGEAYAKFVDADVLKVVCVYTPYSTGSYDAWRFFSSIDSLNYNGFYFVVDRTEQNAATYYTSYKVDSVNHEFVPSEISSSSSYIMTYGIHDTSKATSHTVQACYVTMDGTKVYGAETVFSVGSITTATILGL